MYMLGVGTYGKGSQIERDRNNLVPLWKTPVV